MKKENQLSTALLETISIFLSASLYVGIAQKRLQSADCQDDDDNLSLMKLALLSKCSSLENAILDVVEICRAQYDELTIKGL